MNSDHYREEREGPGSIRGADPFRGPPDIFSRRCPSRWDLQINM